MHEWNIRDSANYFVDQKKIAEAKRIAQEVLKTSPFPNFHKTTAYLLKYGKNLSPDDIKSFEKFIIEAKTA